MNTIPELLQAAYSRWNDAEQLGFIGMELESRSRLTFARVLLSRAIELSPLHHPEWYLSLAFAHFRDVGNLAADGEQILVSGIEETDSDFLKAAYLSVLEVDSHDDMADGLIDYLQESNEISVLFALGYSLLWRGDTQKAREILARAICLLPDQATVLGLDMYCGAMNWMFGQGSDINPLVDIYPYLQRLIRSFPDTYNYRALTIQMFQTMKNYDAVQTIAIETLRIFPDEETTMVALASALEKLDKKNEAIIWYNRAIGAKPSYIRARVMLAKLYERDGLTALAEQILREIPGAFPEFYAGTLEIAYFLHRHNRHEEAMSMFQYGYERLKPFEKATVEVHPDGKALFTAMQGFVLPVLQ